MNSIGHSPFFKETTIVEVDLFINMPYNEYMNNPTATSITLENLKDYIGSASLDRLPPKRSKEDLRKLAEISKEIQELKRESENENNMGSPKST